jgi:cell division protein FtsQ
MLALGGLIVAVVGFGLPRAVDRVLESELLTVNTVTVHGNERISRGEVLSLLEGIYGGSLVTGDLEIWRQKLLTSPWVADATIRRVLPGGLAVYIVERQPMGIARIRGGLFLVDGSGAVIDAYGPNYAEFDLPIIDGLGMDGESGATVDASRARLASRLMSELSRRSGLAGQVSQIDVTDPRDAVVLLKGETALIRLGDTNFSERIASYLDLKPALLGRVDEIDYVDLRFDERVYVGPRSSRSDD